MSGALVAIAITFILSISSLTVVLLRVSPLMAPEYALPFFFLSAFIVSASCAALLLLFVKGSMLFFALRNNAVPHPSRRKRIIVSSSLRQGIFFALGTCLILFMWLLHILNWWIATLIYAVFLLVEMAIGR